MYKFSFDPLRNTFLIKKSNLNNKTRYTSIFRECKAKFINVLCFVAPLLVPYNFFLCFLEKNLVKVFIQ